MSAADTDKSELNAFHEENQEQNGLPCVFSCLSNSLILNKIFSNLSTLTLLRCSLVNKAWNYECRKVLRDQRRVIAHIGARNPCEDFTSFCSDMINIPVIPYNGLRISIDLSTHTSVSSPCVGHTSELFESVLSIGSFKFLEVNWKIFRKKIENCPVLDVISRLLSSNQLEELFLRVPDDLSPFPECISNPQLKLDYLKKLNLPRQGITQSYLNGIRELVSSAPNLQEFCHDGSSPYVELLLQLQKANVLQNFEFLATRPALNERLARCAPRLRELKVQTEDFRYFSIPHCSSALGMLLESSQNSLKHLRMDAIFLGFLTEFNRQLNKVTKFEILIECPPIDVGRPLVYAVLRKFNFSLIFPKLTHLDFREGSVGLSMSIINEIISRTENTHPADPESYSSVIRHISFYGCLRAHTIQYFSSVFPTIASVYASFSSSSDVPFTQIWGNWPKLTEIVLAIKETSALGWNSWHRRTVNLDAAFCGIFPEEVAELRKLETEDLKRVQVVPIRPSINTLQGLKKLGISLRSSGESKNLFPKAFCFSRVGGLVALKRIPDFRMILATDGQNLAEDLVTAGLASVTYSSSHDLVVEI